MMTSKKRPKEAIVTQRSPYQPRQGYGRDTGPSYAQVLEEIRSAGMIDTITDIVVEPTATNEYLCVVRATCTMPALREGDAVRRYSGLCAAYPRKAGGSVIHGVSNPIYYIHTAESRAKKRAWLDALGRGDGLESDVRTEVFAERARQQGTGMVLPKPVLVAPVNITDEQALRLAQKVGRPVDAFIGISRAEANRIWAEHEQSQSDGDEE